MRQRGDLPARVLKMRAVGIERLRDLDHARRALQVALLALRHVGTATISAITMMQLLVCLGSSLQFSTI